MVRIKDLDGKLVLITGGSSGIGKAAAGKLSEMGSKVVIAARGKERLERTKTEIGGVIECYAVDISNWKETLELSRKVVKDHGPLDILINSAGIVHPGKLSDLEHEKVRSMVDIDLLGTMNTCKAFCTRMNGPGYIVNISSMAGLIGIFGYTAYSAAKFGVWGFSEALRMELEPENIGVSVVFPPDTDTPQLEFENRTKPKELRNISGSITPISPEKVASSIIKGIRKGDFMIFPDGSSRSAYHANRLAGPVVRSWMDRKVRSTRND